MLNETEKKINKKLQDQEFVNNFRREWREVTAKLNDFKEQQKIINEGKKEKEGFRPTSSSLVFR